MPFASHFAMTIGFFAGIIPSVIMVFMTLKEYDEYYEDKNFFFLMVVGFFAGMMTALIYYWSIFYMAEVLYLLVLIIIVIGFAVYEMLLFTIILSMKRFGAKFDLTYYGVVLGGSIAGIIGMFVIYLYLHTFDLTWQAMLSIIFMVPTLPLLYISLGAMVGFGISQGESFRYSGWMVGIKTIFNFLFIFWLIAFLFWPPERGWELMSIGLAFAVILYLYATREILPAALPESQRRHLRRAKRHRRRK